MVETSVFADAIRWLEAAGITSGCAPTRFCPEDRVTRGQMAAFLARALKLPTPGAPVVFEDATGHLFEAAISKLAAAETGSHGIKSTEISQLLIILNVHLTNNANWCGCEQ